jgi:hypothetical protein
MAHGYEDRLVAYLDILGWEDATSRLAPEKLIEALEVVHEEPRSFNEAERKRLIEFGKQPGVQINQGYLKIHAAAFSDNIAISQPKSFGTRIFSIRRICLQLLQLGFLTRGAVSVGQLYHEDNMVFGPALNRAHAIEVKQAVFPRIICDDAVVAMLKDQADFKHEVISDTDGKYVVNLYRPAFLKAPACLWKQFLDGYYRFDHTLAIIENNIIHLAADTRKLDKWKYMKGHVRAAKKRLFEFIGADLPNEYRPHE